MDAVNSVVIVTSLSIVWIITWLYLVFDCVVLAGWITVYVAICGYVFVGCVFVVLRGLFVCYVMGGGCVVGAALLWVWVCLLLLACFWCLILLVAVVGSFCY